MGKKEQNIKSAESFASLVDNYSFQTYVDKGRIAPLTNFTFFVGAGFSKSWDERYPTADEIFNIYDSDRTAFSSEIHQFATRFGYFPYRELSPKILKDIVYQLHMQLKYPSIRTRYMDDNSISILLNELKALIQKNFQSKIGNHSWDEERCRFLLPYKLAASQKSILEFFRYIELQEDGSHGITSGVRMNFITTNYDYVIETILDSISASYDEPIFFYTYRGVTPVYISGLDNPTIVHNHTLVRNLLKINGGFEIFHNANEYHFDYRKKDFDEIRKNPPCIILPCRDQDYGDNYFSSVFTKAVRLLHESRVLVIVGYSMPDEDFLLRFLLNQFAEDTRDIREKIIFYIDMMSIKDQIAKIHECFPNIDKAGFSVFHYSGTFEEWVKKVNDNFKWKEP